MPNGGSNADKGALSTAQAREIARVAGNIWKAKVGRGPETSKAFASEDAFAMVFAKVLTSTEQALVEDGRSEMVRAMRRQIFEVSREELVEAVEQTSGRKVATVLYDAAPKDDTSGFLFVFAPE